MLISIDDGDPRPIYLQIIAQIKDQVIGGNLRSGDELPGVRELARSLGVNLHTVHKAYQKLRDDGVIHLRLGRRARVARPPAKPPSRRDIEMSITVPLSELINEAFRLRLSVEQIRQLVDELLAKKKKTGKDLP